MTHLLTRSPADHCSKTHGLPELVSALQEGGKLRHPSFTKCPGEDLVFLVLYVFFDVVGQVSAGSRQVVEMCVCVCVCVWGYHNGLQGHKEVAPVVGLQGEFSSSEVHIHHSQ